jgi:uncharacterized membrane protein YraQ (UPF0718 family)
VEIRKGFGSKSKFILLFMSLVLLITLAVGFLDYRGNMDYSIVQNFSTIFISIILEAMPFIMLGAFVSALIQVFVSEQFIEKIIPKNKLMAFLGAALIGIIFPVCECAIVPISRRLMKKGVPAGIAITFMLAVPIVNPITLLSTYYAFYDKPSIVFIRGGLGMLIAMVVGYLVDYVGKENPMPIKQNSYESDSTCYCGCENQGGLNYKHSKVRSVLEHTNKELLDISKYLIFGAFISSVFQATVSKAYVAGIGQHMYYSIFAMMVLAFILSICSEADAFIARTFLGQFTIGSIVAFLILGPMIDIKNTIMLIGNFKLKLVIELIIYISLIVFFVGSIINVFSIMGVI